MGSHPDAVRAYPRQVQINRYVGGVGEGFSRLVDDEFLLHAVGPQSRYAAFLTLVSLQFFRI